ncbi:prothymosin alpha-related family protein [Striga asiatica]|uniref:Prothymosin alpha-related family protein n=1 Tax=Striga asiatica TaxID=4170 RepID=A0A5A7QUY1_STRAF|nr:prothymosin alpha-related family protein [Striga asiatica]
MEEEKEGDIRVPLVFTVFCLSVTAGGVFLVIYVFFPGYSQAWYPIAALVLIASPWIFWLLTYIYACIKGCFCRDGGGAVPHQISRRQTTRNGSSATATQRVGSSREPEMPLAYSA